MSQTGNESGKTMKRDEDNRTVLERTIPTGQYMLVLDRTTCIGCGICSDNCPSVAIEYFPAEFKGTRRISRPYIDFDLEKCVFCGECVAICPMRALQMMINGEEKVPVIDSNVFAVTTRKRW